MVLSAAAEAMTPTAQIKAQFLQDPLKRPTARLALAHRSSIRDCSALWISAAYEFRKTALCSQSSYAPPCLTCATPSEMACRACYEPWCGLCVRDGWNCYGCPPEISDADFRRREAEGFCASIPAADLGVPALDLVKDM